MKKYILLITITVCLSVDYTNAQNTEEKVKPEFLSVQTFKQKITNYELGKQNEWAYLGDKPCIIDFTADWCGWCRKLSPILEETAILYKGQIYVYKIDTEKQRELAALFGVRGLPALLFVPMGQTPTMVSGFRPKEQLIEEINKYLLKK
jgi:thioredoxin